MSLLDLLREVLDLLKDEANANVLCFLSREDNLLQWSVSRLSELNP
jgi:16S rRNA C1402 N4-methylase RsmH